MSGEHYAAIDILSREIRSYTAAMFRPDMPHDQADLVASLIEEEDLTASLGETLYQIARRVERQPFSAGRPGAGRRHARSGRRAMRAITPPTGAAPHVSAEAARRAARACGAARALPEAGAELPWAERGAILTLLGSAERAFYLIERIDAERRSVSRSVPTAQPAQEQPRAGDLGAAAAMPA